MATKQNLPCALTLNAEKKLIIEANKLMPLRQSAFDVVSHITDIALCFKNTHDWRTDSAHLFLMSYVLLQYYREPLETQFERASIDSTIEKMPEPNDDYDEDELVHVHDEGSIAQIALEEVFKESAPDALTMTQGISRCFSAYDPNITTRVIANMSARWEKQLKLYETEDNLWGDLPQQAKFYHPEAAEHMTLEEFSGMLWGTSQKFARTSAEILPDGARKAFVKAIMELTMTEFVLALAYECKLASTKATRTTKRARVGKPARRAKTIKKKPNQAQTPLRLAVDNTL